MENRLIEIKDLQVGDEIMISCQSYFKYLRVIAPPQLGKKTSYRTNKLLYKSVRCTTRQEEKLSYAYTNSQGQIINRLTKEWILSPDEHNMIISQDLNYRQIWLIKRKGQI